MNKPFDSNATLRKGHEDRFLAKLEEAMPQKKQKRKYYLQIASAVLVLISISAIAVFQLLPVGTKRGDVNPRQVVEVDSSSSIKNQTEVDKRPQITLGDLSPDLKKVENYYVAGINVTLASLEITDTNRKVFEGYMEKLTELNNEYRNLTEELNSSGPNEQTVNALINNLQLRLQLLYRLKNKLEEFKKSKQNEKYS